MKKFTFYFVVNAIPAPEQDEILLRTRSDRQNMPHFLASLTPQRRHDQRRDVRQRAQSQCRYRYRAFLILIQFLNRENKNRSSKKRKIISRSPKNLHLFFNSSS